MCDLVELLPEDLIVQHLLPANIGGWSIGVSKGIKVYHKPSGLEVSYDKHSSQHRNRKECTLILQDLLTKFDAGDIVYTSLGLGEYVEQGFGERYYFLGEDGTAHNCGFDYIAHTEEGYRYKQRCVLEKELSSLEDRYVRESGEIKDKMFELEK